MSEILVVFLSPSNQIPQDSKSIPSLDAIQHDILSTRLQGANVCYIATQQRVISDDPLSTLGTPPKHGLTAKLCALCLFTEYRLLFQQLSPAAPVTAKRNCDQGTMTNTRTNVIIIIINS
jgi:hypothetical protein